MDCLDKPLGGFDDPRAGLPVDEESLHGNAAPPTALPLHEGKYAVDVRAPPLIDRLIIVADDAQFDRRACEQADELLLRRIDVLVLIDDEMLQVLF